MRAFWRRSSPEDDTDAANRAALKFLEGLLARAGAADVPAFGKCSWGMINPILEANSAAIEALTRRVEELEAKEKSKT